MNINFSLGIIVGFIAAAMLTYARIEVAEWRAAHANSQVAALNECIENWADNISKFEGTDAQRCEFMISNRLMCKQ